MKGKFVLLATLALLALAVAFTVHYPALAGGTTKISGLGFFANPGECNDSQGADADFAVKLTGDLEGCLYTYVETADCSPSGTYRETGHELFVSQGNAADTFGTTYRFEGKISRLRQFDRRDLWTLSTSDCRGQWHGCVHGCHRATRL